jgi:pimeloyl-ACP methyl ester carboxylesterase
MADDAVAVMDALGWDRAHVLGVSMGGMIAQTLAINHPDRVKSLVSVSSTPSPDLGRPSYAALRVLAMKPGKSAEDLGDRMVRQFRIIGSPAYPLDEQWLRDYARKAFVRGYNPAGGRRQLAAVIASGSRTQALHRVRIPTLVVHGAEDILIRPWAGWATAAYIRGARYVVHRGMGHDLPRELWPAFVADVSDLAASAG